MAGHERFIFRVYVALVRSFMFINLYVISDWLCITLEVRHWLGSITRGWVVRNRCVLSRVYSAHCPVEIQSCESMDPLLGRAEGPWWEIPVIKILTPPVLLLGAVLNPSKYHTVYCTKTSSPMQNNGGWALLYWILLNPTTHVEDSGGTGMVRLITFLVGYVLHKTGCVLT